MELKKTDRANLEKRKGLFLQLGMVVVLGLVLIAFEWKSQPELDSSLTKLASVDVEEEIIPVTRQEEVKPPPPPPPPQINDVLTIVEDDVEIEDEFVIEDVEADQDDEVEIQAFEEEEEEEEAEVFFIVEDMPSFDGKGQNGFRTYIAKNLRYPDIAAENGIQGRVYVRFVVNEKGAVTGAKVVRGVDPALDKEAIRVVMSSPKWAPGKQRGKSVKVSFTFPIVFVLQ